MSKRASAANLSSRNKVRFPVMSTTTEGKVFADLHRRLCRFEAEAAIRACMNRYMHLCDALDGSTPLDELVCLFTEDAVWEGVGAKYATTFPRLVGRAALGAMFGKYMTDPPHFAVNVHFLTSELIDVDDDLNRAHGNWIMLQTSTFASGASHLNAARLNVDFAPGGDGRWRMAHFRTENLFSRPVDAWNRADPVPVPQ